MVATIKLEINPNIDIDLATEVIIEARVISIEE